MERLSPRPLDLVAAPLVAVFGDELTFDRVADGVRWTFRGQAATVHVCADGSVEARFFTAPTVDAVRGTEAACVYRPHGRAYAPTAAGCERMVADTVAFFSGTREPRFAFVDVAPPVDRALMKAR